MLYCKSDYEFCTPSNNYDIFLSFARLLDDLRFQVRFKLAPGNLFIVDNTRVIHGLPQDNAGHGIDGQHEEVGARALEPYFVPAVTEPMRLHVAATRYLCI